MHLFMAVRSLRERTRVGGRHFFVGRSPSPPIKQRLSARRARSDPLQRVLRPPDGHDERAAGRRNRFMGTRGCAIITLAGALSAALAGGGGPPAEQKANLP